MNTIDATLAEFQGIYTKALAESAEYFHHKTECERLGIISVIAHAWAVVIDEPSCNNAIGYTDDRKAFCLNGVRGHLCGTSFFTREDAEAIAKDWSSKAPPTLKKVRVIHKDELAMARKVDAEASLAMINDRIAERSNLPAPA